MHVYVVFNNIHTLFARLFQKQFFNLATYLKAHKIVI